MLRAALVFLRLHCMTPACVWLCSGGDMSQAWVDLSPYGLSSLEVEMSLTLGQFMQEVHVQKGVLPHHATLIL